MNFLVQPWDHQRKAIDKALAKIDERWACNDLALFFDMGTGKTSTTINILRGTFAEEKRIMRTLILCPVVVCENWRREFKVHSKLGNKVIVLTGSQKQRIKTFLKYSSSDVIFVTNYEALTMSELLQEIVEWNPEILVCDESQRLKNHEAKRTRQATLLADLCKRRFILTGTPILNSPMDIFSQFRILDGGATFGKNFFAFRATYFWDKNAGMPSNIHFPKWEARDEIEELFNEKIYAKAMRVMKHECLDLPPFVRTEVYVELAAEQARVYKEMEKEFITYLDDEACVAQIALTKALRLMQIVSGYVKTEEGNEIALPKNPRLDALEDLLESIPRNEKTIVWTTFQENYRQIASLCERMKLPYAQLHGGIGGKKRQEEIDRFQTDPACRVLIANQAAGGVGVNLTAASYAIFYARNFSLEQDLQANDRNYRGGSEVHQKITRIDMVAPGTIDEIILEALRTKKDMSERILALKEMLKR